MNNLRHPDLTSAMDQLEQVMAHANSVKTAATDFVDAIHKHQNKQTIVLDAATVGIEGIQCFNDLKALTHPHLD